MIPTLSTTAAAHSTSTAAHSTHPSALAHPRHKRPVLAREADSTYWMARYVERAENVGRLMQASAECVIDVRDVAPAFMDRQWQSVLRIMHADEPTANAASTVPYGDQVAQLMTLAEENMNSLASCLTRARENASSRSSPMPTAFVTSSASGSAKRC